MTIYHEYRHYSPLTDSEMVRVSMVGRQNQEYFSIIAAEPSGKAYRERRDKALDALEEAIDRGDPPGHYEVQSDRPGG